MIEKLLVANRGEIALRVMRACRELGIRCVAVFSDADGASKHVQFADEAYPLGAPSPAESYLNIERIVRVAEEAGCDAVHPGYGFLAENAIFAKECERHNLIFVGPRSSTLKLTGNKLACRTTLRRTGIRVLPASEKIVTEEQEAAAVADEVGWPILLKSAFGGGGRGIRIVRDRRELLESFSPVQREAKAAFGRFGVYVEKFVTGARHVEFQILVDGRGHAVHLGERECSIQRRFQKLLEVSPSPIVNTKLRNHMGELALRAAKGVGYTNAGTIEFLVAPDGNFYFIEVNSRLQVEHPVTELVTGIDLVKQQLLVASGEELGIEQDVVTLNGCAIECRINAEDPLREFAPSAGRVERYEPPAGPGVRVDSALYDGYEIPVFYDSLIAKLITWGRSFDEARLRMRNALDEMVVEGIATTIPLHRVIVEDAAFQRGELSTEFLEKRGIMTVLEQRDRESRQRLEEVANIAAAIHSTISSTRDEKRLSPPRKRPATWWRERLQQVAAPPEAAGRFIDEA